MDLKKPRCGPALRRPLTKKLLRAAFPHYIPLVDRVNRDAKIADWLRANKAAPVFDNRFDLYDHIISNVLDSNEPIDYFEFGVFRGESIGYWSRHSVHAQSRFFGFDSFEGLPEDWSRTRKTGHFSTGGALPTIDDRRVKIFKGWFQQSLRPFLDTFQPQSRLVIQVDCDLYSSALYCLTQIDRFVSRGTIMIFDEYSDPLHEFRAFEDYCAAYMRKARAIGMTAAYAEQAAFLIE